MKTFNKGQVSNYFIGIVFLMIFVIISLISWVVLKEFLVVYGTTSVSSPDGVNLGNKYLGILNIFDYITVIMMLVFVVGVGLTAYKLPTQKTAYIVNFVLAGFYGFISLFFNYFFSSIASESVFNAAIVYFPRSITLCTNFHWIMLLMVIVGSLALYAKPEDRFAQNE